MQTKTKRQCRKLQNSNLKTKYYKGRIKWSLTTECSVVDQRAFKSLTENPVSRWWDWNERFGYFWKLVHESNAISLKVPSGFLKFHKIVLGKINRWESYGNSW